MSREATGTITVDTLADGTRAFRLRFGNKGRRDRVTLHERRDCECGCGGGWNERTAAIELRNIVARVEAGVWQKRERTAPKSHPGGDRVPTFHEYASAWLQAKLEGSIGDRPIGPATEADYRWRLRKHLLPYFSKYRLDEIDATACQAFKAAKLKEAADIRKAVEAGATIRDRGGRPPARLDPLPSAS